MTVRILFVDLRDTSYETARKDIPWNPSLSASHVVEVALGASVARQVSDDLAADSPGLTVSWVNQTTSQHSGIGGVGDLDWMLQDDSILTILYEDETTTDELRDASDNWLLENGD